MTAYITKFFIRWNSSDKIEWKKNYCCPIRNSRTDEYVPIVNWSRVCTEMENGTGNLSSEQEMTSECTAEGCESESRYNSMCLRHNALPTYIIDPGLSTGHENLAVSLCQVETTILLSDLIVLLRNHARWYSRMHTYKRLIVRSVYIIH